MTTSDIQITLSDYPSSTVTYAMPSNMTLSDFWAIAAYYTAPRISETPVHFKELPTAMTPDQSLNLLPKRRKLGLGAGSAQMSADFDEELGGDLGFGEE